jgi:hypothetical protein
MSYSDLYNRYMQEANAYAQQYGLDPSTTHNGAWDAFRHAYASAEMTREYGSAVAHAAGELNEIRGDIKHNQPSWERNMDEWNNAVGRETGKKSTSSADSAQRVYDALKRRDLITDPINDPRDNKDTWDRIKDQMRDWWDRAKRWTWPRDPIIVDLDGDGLETVGLASNIYFDFDANGVLTKTGWARRTCRRPNRGRQQQRDYQQRRAARHQDAQFGDQKKPCRLGKADGGRAAIVRMWRGG